MRSPEVNISPWRFHSEWSHCLFAWAPITSTWCAQGSPNIVKCLSEGFRMNLHPRWDLGRHTDSPWVLQANHHAEMQLQLHVVCLTPFIMSCEPMRSISVPKILSQSPLFSRGWVSGGTKSFYVPIYLEVFPSELKVVVCQLVWASLGRHFMKFLYCDVPGKSLKKAFRRQTKDNIRNFFYFRCVQRGSTINRWLILSLSSKQQRAGSDVEFGGQR